MALLNEAELRAQACTAADLPEIWPICGLWDWSVTESLTIADGDTSELFGLNPQFTTDQFYRAVHPDDRARVILATQAALNERKQYACDYRVISGSAQRWVHARANVSLESNRMTGAVVWLPVWHAPVFRWKE